jgi:ATP-dependent Clp protease protease subunit
MRVLALAIVPFLVVSAVDIRPTGQPGDKLTQERERTELERHKSDRQRSILDLKERQMEYEFKKKVHEVRMQRIKEMLEKEKAARVEKGAYTHEVVVQNLVRVSDRIIHMPQVIRYSNSDMIAKKISFYNRKNSYPIFLVVDISFGGSVMGGELMLKAIAASKAKVYIVVKTFCASMCAIITSTFADQAYVFRSATLLHHEISVGVMGNTSAHRDYLKRLEYWQHKLLLPIAKRLDTTPEKFVARLYEIQRGGDATLFAEQALEEKWIVNIVDGIVDESFEEVKNHGQSEMAMEEGDGHSDIVGDILYIAPKLKFEKKSN